MAKIILASKNGNQGRFSETAWKRGRMQSEGWVITGTFNADEISNEVIPVTDVQIDDIPLENITQSSQHVDGTKGDYESVLEKVESEDTDETEKQKKERIKAFLTNKGVPFHHALGIAKLQKLYDENTK